MTSLEKKRKVISLLDDEGEGDEIVKSTKKKCRALLSLVSYNIDGLNSFCLSLRTLHILQTIVMRRPDLSAGGGGGDIPTHRQLSQETLLPSVWRLPLLRIPNLLHHHLSAH